MRMLSGTALCLGTTILILSAVRSPALDKAAAGPVKDEPAARAASRDLHPQFERFKLTRRSQGNRNTCSVFTMAGAMEYALARHGRTGLRVSVEFLNWASNQLTGRPEDGSFFSDVWRGFEKYGVCAEADMPYAKTFDPALCPSPEALRRAEAIRGAGLRMHWIKRWDPTKGVTDGQLMEIKRVIGKGWPVCGGFLWPKTGFERWNGNVLAMVPRENVRDGHSVLLVGYRDDARQPGGGVFLIRNSKNGPRRGAMTYEYIRAYMNDAVWIEPAPKPAKGSPGRGGRRTAS